MSERPWKRTVSCTATRDTAVLQHLSDMRPHPDAMLKEKYGEHYFISIAALKANHDIVPTTVNGIDCHVMRHGELAV